MGSGGEKPEFDLDRAIALAEACELSNLRRPEVLARLRGRRDVIDASFHDSHHGPQAYVACMTNEVRLIFRGTDRIKRDQPDRNIPGIMQDWSKNLDYLPIRGPFGGYVHHGFYRSLIEVEGGPTEFWRGIRSALVSAGPERPLWLSGSSQGAILATLAASLLLEEGQEIEGLYTFGSPCAGNAVFARAIEDSLPNFYRVVNRNDMMARIPPPFVHFGPGHVIYAPAGSLRHVASDGRIEREMTSWKSLTDGATELVEGMHRLFTKEHVADAFARLSGLADGGLTDHLIERYREALHAAKRHRDEAD